MLRNFFLLIISSLFVTPLLEAQTPKRDYAAEALAGFDETTGLWFPPDAPRDAYLDPSDATHNLGAAWRRIFTSDAALRQAVCELVSDPRREARRATLSQFVKQRRTMLDMFCVGAAHHEQQQQKEEAAWRARERDFDAWRNVAAARALDDGARAAKELELEVAPADTAGSDESLRRSFEILGLIPQSDYAVYRLLSQNPFRGAQSESRFVALLKGLLEREAAPVMPEAARYQAALCAFHFYRGDVAKARALARTMIGNPDLERWSTSNGAFLALLDHLAGQRGALARFASACDVPERSKDVYVGRPPGAYCFDVVSALADHSIALSGAKAPAGLVEVLSDSIRAEPTRWRPRITALQRIEVLDPTRARELTDDLLRVPATLVPLEIRLDAVTLVASTSRRLKDFGRAVASYDFFLANLHYHPAATSPDLWSRLTALEYEERGPRNGYERAPGLEVTWALGQKVATNLEAGDLSGARRALETYLSESLRLVDALQNDRKRVSDLVDTKGMPQAAVDELRRFLDENSDATVRRARDEARYARQFLGDLGKAYLKAGRREEASRIVAYLSSQTGPEGWSIPVNLYELYWGPKNRGTPLVPAASPWATADSPPRPRHP